jgi:hypothetical protein
MRRHEHISGLKVRIGGNAARTSWKALSGLSSRPTQANIGLEWATRHSREPLSENCDGSRYTLSEPRNALPA